MRQWLKLSVAVFAIVLLARVESHAKAADLGSDPACKSMTATSMGGPAPHRPTTLVLRWLGTSNYELAYRDKVLLFDAYYTQMSRARSLGFKPEDITKADAILLGHGHYDHISDAAPVAKRIGAKVYGAPPSIEYLKSVGMTDDQLVEWKGGEGATFGPIKIQSILGHHSIIGPEVGKSMTYYRQMQEAVGGPFTDEEKARDAAVRHTGSSSPKIATEGVLAYFITFDNGFKMVYQDTAGPVTDPENAMEHTFGKPDLGILPYCCNISMLPASMALVREFQPKILLPDHHDETGGGWIDMPTYPFFSAVRSEFPDTVTIEPLYRAPICIDTKTKDIFVGPLGH